MSNFYINIDRSTFSNGSSVVRTDKGADELSIDKSVLSELQQIRNKLEQAEPEIADLLSDLLKAIQEQNKSKASRIVQQISSGFAASALANIASGSLLTFLGIR